MEGNKRNTEIDIIKGICIIAIVFTHAGHPILWFGFFMVYGFYFVAGYTFRDKSILKFVKDKVMRIYVSFVSANIIAMLIIKVLTQIHERYRMGSLGLMAGIKKALSFNISSDLMAPSWFMFPLILILFIFYFLNRIVKNEKLLLSITFIIFIFTHVFYKELSQYIWCNCAFITNVGIGLFICACGNFLRKNKEIENKLFNGELAIELFVVCTIVMFSICNKVGLDVRAGYCSKPLYNIIAIFAGLYWLIYISKYLRNSELISKVLSIVGYYSMSIMFFHVISYSLVTLIVYDLFELPFPEQWPIAYTDGVLGIISAVVGIIVPMLVAKAAKWVKIKKKNTYISI